MSPWEHVTEQSWTSHSGQEAKRDRKQSVWLPWLSGIFGDAEGVPP